MDDGDGDAEDDDGDDDDDGQSDGYIHGSMMMPSSRILNPASKTRRQFLHLCNHRSTLTSCWGFLSDGSSRVADLGLRPI